MSESHPQKRRLGYARVSTYGHTLDAQLDQLRGAGCATIYREKASEVLGQLDVDDVLVMTRLDRKAGFRSLGNTWADITTAHGRLMLTALDGLPSSSAS